MPTIVWIILGIIVVPMVLRFLLALLLMIANSGKKGCKVPNCPNLPMAQTTANRIFIIGIGPNYQVAERSARWMCETHNYNAALDQVMGR